MIKVAFFGLGIMGLPMARYLQKSGTSLRVWNRNYKKAEEFVATYGAYTSKNIEEVVKDVDFAIMCLGNDNSVEEITFGENGFVKFMKKGSVVVDHTTTSANISKNLYKRCEELGIEFVDAPVTGGQAGAENGALTIMCGGKKDVFEKVKNVISCYTKNIEYFGAVGSGQVAKMANQICIAGILASLAEAIDLAQKSGIDADRLFKLISSGAAGSWQMANRHEMMIKRDYKENIGFPVEWMIKDLEYCIKKGEEIGCKLDITREITAKYKQVRDEINARFDTSSLILLLK